MQIARFLSESDDNSCGPVSMEPTETLSTEISDMLIECFKHYPHRTAIEVGEQSVSYGNLDLKSNAVRDLLAARGIQKRSIVALLLDDTVELVAAILGILKADSVFVPFDPRYPANRIKAMAQTANPQALLVQKRFTELAQSIVANDDLGCMVVPVDEVQIPFTTSPAIVGALERNLAPANDLPPDMGYIYFTSGSTGQPKGIAGNLLGLSHFINWEAEALGVTEEFRVSQLTPPSFDPFLRDVFLPLCSGGTLCIPPDRETLLDSEKLVSWIDDSRITLIHCTPSLFRSILNQPLRRDCFQSLKYIVLAGEPLFPSDIRKWFSIFDERVQLVNVYGPTETTLAKFCHFVRRRDQERRIIPVGRPIDGAEAFVLSEARELCPAGSIGEICIRTRYRSFGYYNQPGMTQEVFVPNPFNPDDPDDLIYRTGDIGRVATGGEFELIGRQDSQVKIRGIRVELGEIETLLRDHPDISEAAVKDWDDDDHQKFLCAYIVSDTEPDASELRSFLAQWLPEVSIPSAFMKLDELSLSLNGKINRRALPDPRTRTRREDEYLGPRNDLEKRIMEIWKAILEVPQIGIHDTFFSLGGHSLMAIRVVARMRKELSVEIPLRLLFEHPTVTALAQVLAPTIEGTREVSEAGSARCAASQASIVPGTPVPENQSDIAANASRAF